MGFLLLSLYAVIGRVLVFLFQMLLILHDL
jgi:hypothetical protein